MTCKNCGSDSTIKAHLIPRVFCKQVQTGPSHAAGIKPDGSFSISQSGVWDDSILCGTCDNDLGKLENYAHKVLTAVREAKTEQVWRACVAEGVEPEKIMRFCAAILYKYSLTSKEKGRIDLGPFQELCRQTAFGEISVPPEIDVFTFRPIRFWNDDGIFAYRAPSPDRKSGINLYRLLVGGALFFIKVDKRPFVDPLVTPFSLQAAKEFPYLVVPAQFLEEYKIPAGLWEKNSQFSTYLDRVAKQSKH